MKKFIRPFNRVPRVARVTCIALVSTVLIVCFTRVFDLPIDDEVYDLIVSGKLTEQSLYTQIFKTLGRVAPGKHCPPVLDNYPNGRAKEKFHTDKDFIFSREYLNSLLQVDETCLDELSASHSEYMNFIQNTDIQFGDTSSVSGNGVVMVGGGRFDFLALMNVQWLKVLKSELPIEVFIGSKKEYDPKFCNEILPRFGDNVKCTLLWDHMSEGLFRKFNIKGFQYKAFALLVSSFENILFLDADNVPTKLPDYLFDSAVYREHNLVLWPDAWARTTSPKFYEDIAHVHLGERPIRGYFMDEEEFNYHDLEGTVPNPTSESGMILVNKKTHSKALLLALYYNIFGPSYFYPLFTQGGAGEGDKETFITAATLMKSKYYQVDHSFSFIGYHEDGGFNSKALGQHDPVVDYKNSLLEDKSQKSKPEVLFMHLSYPKLTPELLIVKKQELVNEKTGKHRRLYPGDGINYDFELQIFEVFTQFLCLEYDSSDDLITVVGKGVGVDLNQFEDRKTLQKQCHDYFIPHMKFLKENPK